MYYFTVKYIQLYCQLFAVKVLKHKQLKIYKMSKSNSDENISFSKEVFSNPDMSNKINVIPSRSVRVERIIEAFQLETASYKSEVLNEIHCLKREILYAFHKSKSANGIKPGEIDDLLLVEKQDSFTFTNIQFKEIICLDRYAKNGTKIQNPTITEIIKQQCELLLNEKLNSSYEKNEFSLLNSKRKDK